MPLTHTVLVFFRRSSRQQQKMCIFLHRKICRPRTWLSSSFPEKNTFALHFAMFFFQHFFFPDKFRTYSPSFRERKIKRHRKNKDLLTNSSDNYSPKASKVFFFQGNKYDSFSLLPPKSKYFAPFPPPPPPHF